MKELPQGGLIGKTARAAQAVAALNIPLRAGYGAYFLVLAAFPGLLLVLKLPALYQPDGGGSHGGVGKCAAGGHDREHSGAGYEHLSEFLLHGGGGFPC